MTNKTLHNSDISGARENISDLQTFGDGDTFKLICKASSQREGWMKSTKAMEIAGLGCVVQVTTQQGNNVAEAVCFVPGVRIEESVAPESTAVISRRLVALPMLQQVLSRAATDILTHGMDG